MARFPYYKQNIAELGKLLAKARTDEAYRQYFLSAPQAELTRIGLPETACKLMTFKVVDGLNENAVALPYKLNQDKLDRADPEYLKGLAGTFSLVN